MNARARLLIVPAFVAAIAVASTGARSATGVTASAADSAAVAKAVKNFHTALSTGDSVTALSLLAEDAVILESGEVESRSVYRSHHLPEDIKFAKSVAAKRGPLHIHVEGSSAWTAAASTNQGEFNGRAINSTGAESMVLTNRGGKWLIRSIHWSSRNRRA